MTNTIKPLMLSGLLAFIAHNVDAKSEWNVKQSFSCEVVDTVYMEISDGKPKRYKGIQDEMQIGDVLNIEVSLISWSENELHFETKALKGSEEIGLFRSWATATLGPYDNVEFKTEFGMVTGYG